MPEVLPRLSQEFRDFLIEAKSEHGYGQPGTIDVASEAGGVRIVYERDPFVYVDSFEGGSPYGGHESVAVRMDNTLVPVWNMVYRETFNAAPGQEISVLRKVLAQPDPAFPIRGPRHWVDESTAYDLHKVDRNSQLEGFDAEEVIAVEDENGQRRRIYVARFMGGLANRILRLEATNPIWLAHE